MQRRLSIQNKDIPILKMPIHLLIHRRRPRIQPLLHGPRLVPLRRHQLIRDRRPLLDSELVQGLLSTILVLDHTGTRVPVRASDDPLAHLMEVGCGDGFGEGQLACEDWWDTDLAGLDVGVW